MPVVPTFAERTVMLRLNQAPALLLDLLAALSFRIVLAGFRLGVFDHLTAGPATRDEIVDRLGGDPRGVGLLLDALENLGYLRRRGGRYENTAMTAKWLPLVSEGVEFFAHMIDEWEHLDECVRDVDAWTDDKSTWTREKWRVFENGMRAFARLNVGELVSKLRVTASDRRLVDLGGGHGLHSVECCRRHPQLRATVVDVAEAEPSFRRTVEGCGLESRLEFVAGDFMLDDFGAGYDIALLANIVHGFDPDQNRELFKRVAGVLAPNGRIAILDSVPGRRAGNVGRAFGSIMALNMYLSTGTQTYDSQMMGTWLRDAGFEAPRVSRFVRTPGLTLVTAQLA